MGDAVADFFEREKQMLDQVSDDVVPDVPPPIPDTSDFESAIPSTDQILGDDVGSLVESTPGVPLSSVNGIPSVNSSSNLVGADSVPSSTSLSYSPAPVTRIEAENIRKWREEQQVLLEKKDAAEAKKIVEWKELAKVELAEWYQQREKALAAAKLANKEAEAERLAAIDKEQGEAAQWDQIAKMCEGKAQKGGKDVSRMKNLLLHLKDMNKK